MSFTDRQINTLVVRSRVRIPHFTAVTHLSWVNWTEDLISEIWTAETKQTRASKQSSPETFEIEQKSNGTAVDLNFYIPCNKNGINKQ